MLNLDLSPVPRKSQRLIKVVQQVPNLVVHKRTGKHNYVQYRLNSRSKVTRKFMYLRETSELPQAFREALETRFKVRMKILIKIYHKFRLKRKQESTLSTKIVTQTKRM